jgi:hypothetical protein
MNFYQALNNAFNKNAGITGVTGTPYQAPVTTQQVAPQQPTDYMAPQDTVGIDFPAAGGGGAEAEIVKVMAEILAERDKGNLNLNAMSKELEKRGYATRLLDTGQGNTGYSKATIEIIAADGTKVAFKDEDGDGQMGMVDKQFRDKVKLHVPELYQKLVDKSNADSLKGGHESNVIGADGTAKADKWSSAKETGFQGGAQGGPNPTATTTVAPAKGNAAPLPNTPPDKTALAKEETPIGGAQQPAENLEQKAFAATHPAMQQILDNIMKNLEMLGFQPAQNQQYNAIGGPAAHQAVPAEEKGKEAGNAAPQAETKTEAALKEEVNTDNPFANLANVMEQSKQAGAAIRPEFMVLFQIILTIGQLFDAYYAQQQQQQ